MKMTHLTRSVFKFSNGCSRSVLLIITVMSAGLLSEAYANCVRDVNSYTNVRSQPSTSSAVVGKFYKSQSFPYVNEVKTGQSINGNPFWYRVTHMRNTNRYVHKSKVARTTTERHSAIIANVKLNNPDSYLNVRSRPGTCHSVIDQIKNLTFVSVIGSTPPYRDSRPQGIWAEIRDFNSGKYLGFVSDKFLNY